MPGLPQCVATLIAGGRGAQLCPNWDFTTRAYDAANALSGRDLASQVISSPGHVLLLQPVQTKSAADVRARLQGRQIVEEWMAFDTATLEEGVIAIREMHDAGEPRLPIDLVVALLVMRKLDHEHMWAGNAKGYMWSDDIPKGRGVDECYKSRIGHVINVLLQHQILVQKPSRGRSKYALNPGRKPELYEILRQRGFGHVLTTLLSRRETQVPASELDLLAIYDTAPADPSHG